MIQRETGSYGNEGVSYTHQLLRTEALASDAV